MCTYVCMLIAKCVKNKCTLLLLSFYARWRSNEASGVGTGRRKNKRQSLPTKQPQGLHILPLFQRLFDVVVAAVVYVFKSRWKWSALVCVWVFSSRSHCCPFSEFKCIFSFISTHELICFWIQQQLVCTRTYVFRFHAVTDQMIISRNSSICLWHFCGSLYTNTYKHTYIYTDMYVFASIIFSSLHEMQIWNLCVYVWV